MKKVWENFTKISVHKKSKGISDRKYNQKKGDVYAK